MLVLRQASTLATLFVEGKAKLDEDAEADKRLAEVDALCAALRGSPASVQTSKGRTVADSAQIDLFDGKLYMRMRDLNAVARPTRSLAPPTDGGTPLPKSRRSREDCRVPLPASGARLVSGSARSRSASRSIARRC